MPDSREHIELLLTVARAYYVAGQSQDEIARRISFSRATVSRLLEEARARGMVSVQVSHSLDDILRVERSLQRRYGLQAVRVAGTPDPAEPLPEFAAAAASIVAEACRGARILAASDGLTIASVVDALPTCRYDRLRVVQLKGMAPAPTPNAEGPRITRRTAERLGASFDVLRCPLLPLTRGQADQLRRDSRVSRSLAAAAQADVALVGVGGIDVPGAAGRIHQTWLSARYRQEVYELGAVGHVAGHHFDANGQQLQTSFFSQVISVSPRQQHNALRICVARGEAKVLGIKAILAAKLVDVLVTDLATATALDQDASTTRLGASEPMS